MPFYRYRWFITVLAKVHHLNILSQLNPFPYNFSSVFSSSADEVMLDYEYKY
jgi:hypothetical protein